MSPLTPELSPGRRSEGTAPGWMHGPEGIAPPPSHSQGSLVPLLMRSDPPLYLPGCFYINQVLFSTSHALSPGAGGFLEVLSARLKAYFSHANNQPRAHTPSCLLYRAHTLGHHTPARITPGPALGTAPMPHSPPVVFKVANPKPAYPHWPFLPVKTTIQIPPTSISLCLQQTLVLLHVAPQGMECPLLLRSVSMKAILSMVVVLDLVALPYLNNNKTYIKALPHGTHCNYR